MSGLHEYEAWLDEQDARVRVEGDQIVAHFSRDYRFPLAACASRESAMAQARKLALFLLEEERANYSSLPVRFLKLVEKANNLRLEPESSYLPHSVVPLSRISKVETQTRD